MSTTTFQTRSSRIPRIGRSALIAVLVASALGVSAPAPAPVVAAGCQIWAEQPYYNGSINGWGHWYGCPSDARITVVMRQDRRWWPDKTLTSQPGGGRYGSILLSYACGNRFNPIKVFIEVRYGSQKAQSPRAILPCG